MSGTAVEIGRIGWDAFRFSLWPSSFGGKAGRIIGAIGVIVLISHAFDVGFGPTFMSLEEYYSHLLNVTLGRAEPFLRTGLVELKRMIGWHLTLYPHWKYIFVLMEIYFFRDAGTDYVSKLWATGTFRLIWGATVASVSAVAIGVIPLSHGERAADYLIGGIPILGAFAYDVGDSLWGSTFLRTRWAVAHHIEKLAWWADFREDILSDAGRTLIGLGLLWLGLQIPFVQRLGSPGLAVLACLIVLLALYWIWLGASYVKETREEGESWSNAFWRSGEVELGVAMLGVFSWGGMLIVTNEGLSLFGL